MNEIKIREGLRIVCDISHVGNKYLQDNKPWELFKNGFRLLSDVIRWISHIFAQIDLVVTLSWRFLFIFSTLSPRHSHHSFLALHPTFFFQWLSFPMRMRYSLSLSLSFSLPLSHTRFFLFCISHFFFLLFRNISNVIHSSHQSSLLRSFHCRFSLTDTSSIPSLLLPSSRRLIKSLECRPPPPPPPPLLLLPRRSLPPSWLLY